jgi:REP element-mobilizing transposase RayT
VPQSFACLHYHIIFSTKNREPILVPELAERVYGYVGGILEGQHGTLLQIGGMPDHVHLLAGLSREMCVAEAVRLLKANSSKWIHEQFPDLSAFAWQAGYGAFTVSYSNLDAVRFYIQNQQKHHRTKTFQEEFVAYLKRHRLPFDERHLWE